MNLMRLAFIISLTLSLDLKASDENFTIKETQVQTVKYWVID